jgi:hypothetical protein
MADADCICAEGMRDIVPREIPSNIWKKHDKFIEIGCAGVWSNFGTRFGQVLDGYLRVMIGFFGLCVN